MKRAILLLLLLQSAAAFAQPASYTPANLHSHNDYEQPVPFEAAYKAGFGSIEADVFLVNNQLLVAHTEKELSPDRTLEKMYLQPLNALGNTVHPMQLMIDIKTDSVQTLNRLVQVLQQYPALIQNPSLHWVISGNRPAVNTFADYPAFISFDGELHKTYPAAAMQRIAMLSGPMYKFTKWNGKGVITAEDKAILQPLIRKAHEQHKPVRFWGAPDVENAWYQLMHLGVDFINTDNISGASGFLERLPANTYTAAAAYMPYEPTYASDGGTGKVKNIILIIGDGTGLAQWYAGYTANRGQLNVFRIRHTGLSKTSSHDSYITDSAPGSTAFASGVKTNNRFVGVDHTGKALTLLPEIVRRKKMVTGIVTSGDLTDATPADFYAHRSSRDSADGILKDLAVAPVQYLLGSGNPALPANTALLQQQGYHIVHSLDSLPVTAQGRYIVADSIAGLPVLRGRGEWLSAAFDKTTTLLKKNSNGFLLVLEGAQVDYGGHANNIGYVASEVMDLDKVIGKAMQLADADKETLVIITADHETGGLSLLDGDISRGYVSGQFASNDHSGIPVPVYAYGPQSQLFTGVYENTEIFRKILQALGL